MAALIGVGAVIPLGGAGGVPNLDKVVHVCEYLLLAWCVAHATRAATPWRAAALTRAWVIPIGYGAFLEGVQAFIPYRSCDWHDLMANIVGTALGVGVARWLL